MFKKSAILALFLGFTISSVSFGMMGGMGGTIIEQKKVADLYVSVDKNSPIRDVENGLVFKLEIRVYTFVDDGIFQVDGWGKTIVKGLPKTGDKDYITVITDEDEVYFSGKEKGKSVTISVNSDEGEERLTVRVYIRGGQIQIDKE